MRGQKSKTVLRDVDERGATAKGIFPTGNRTRVSRVRVLYPNRLDYRERRMGRSTIADGTVVGR